MKQQRKTKKNAGRKGFKPKPNVPKTDALNNGSIPKNGKPEEKTKATEAEVRTILFSFPDGEKHF